jgi:sulfate permease, SulP family
MSPVDAVRRIDTWLPGVAGFRGYSRTSLRCDLQAGLSVAAYLVPQALAYAALAGLSPITGLWAALPPLVVYAVFGSSRLLSMGPESTTALMTAAIVGPLALGDAARYASFAATMAVLVGIVGLAAGLIGLGFVSSLFSRPVLVGYLAGIAVVMVVGQLGRMSGLTASGDDLLAVVRSLVADAHQISWATVILASTTLVLLVALQRLTSPLVPAPLIGVLITATVVALFALGRFGIEIVGSVPVGLPRPEVPTPSLREVAELVVPALGVAMVAFSDDVLTARAFSVEPSDRVDANAELRALGIANIAVGLVHGFPVSSSGSRTALAAATGARTRAYSLVAFGVVALVLLLGPGFISLVPTAAIAALIVYAAIKLVDVGEFRRLARFRRSELVLALATAVAVACFGVLYGVLAAVGLSILDLLRRLARAHDSIQGFVPGLAGMHDVDDYPRATVVPGLLVYRYDAPLFFANAEDFRRRAIEALDQARPPARWFVLNAEANVEVDMTALDALDGLRAECARRGVVFAMARVKQDLRDALEAAGLLDAIGADRVFMTLPTAVDAFRRQGPGAEVPVEGPRSRSRRPWSLPDSRRPS